MTRPLDKHLDNDEIDCLISSQAEGTRDARRFSEQTGEAQDHVESCPDCSRKVQMHKSVQREISRLQSGRREEASPSCPGEIDWLHVAAGLMSESDARKLMNHASECAYCGPSLRRAIEFLSDEATPDEEYALAELRRSRTVSQKHLPRKLGRLGPLQTESGGEATYWSRRRVIWPNAALVGVVALLLVIAGWWKLTLSRKPSAEQLLAQAYTEQRTLELRIPEAKYAPMRVNLGTKKSHSDRPPALLDAEKMIAEHLNARPNDARWLHAKGEADILEGDFEPAYRNLQLANSLTEGDVAIRIDLATAAAGIGKYGEAVNILREITHSNPKNSVAWFNLALTCEKLELMAEAASAWNSFLRLDSDSPWASEARIKLRTIEQKLDASPPTSGNSAEPKEAVILAGLQRTVVDERIESYLNFAVSDWLPRLGADDTSAREALEATTLVATMAATQHQDRWLREILSDIEDDSAIQDALSSLAEAIEDSREGNYSKAREAARRSEGRFRGHGSTAGVLRAQFEQLYADHLSQQGETCFTESGLLLHDLRGRSYAWLEVQTALERAICANMTGRMGEAKLSANLALELAHAHRYNALHLRATSLTSTLEWTMGDFEGATQLATDGLREFWSGSYPAMAGYNLYAVLDSVAQDSEQWFTQVSTGREALRLLSSDPDHALRAVMHQTLANAALSSGELDVADENFRAANQQLTLASRGGSTRTSWAVAEVGIARMEYLKGQFDSAWRRLQNVEPLLAKTSNRFVLLDFYLTKGDLLVAMGGQWRGAEDAFSHAIAVSEQGLARITTERDRLVWTRLYERSYRAMIELVLTRSPLQAFSWWEWYRSAPLGEIQRARLRGGIIPASRRAFLKAEDRKHFLSTLIDEDTVLLSYILFKKEVGIWIHTSTGTSYRKLPVSPFDLQTLATRFAQDCANPNSDPSTLHNEGRQLFQILVRPYVDLIGSHHKLVIEADGPLDNIAFESLVDDQNGYVGDDYRVSFSPGLIYLSQVRLPIRSLAASRALIVGNPSAILLTNEVLSAIPRADEESQHIAQLLPQSQLLIGREATSSAVLEDIQRADIFHFAGHAVVTKNGLGLVMSGTSSTTTPEFLDALDFGRMHLGHTRLVVLSACATAGNGDHTLNEVNSLARTFISSGVSQVLASRWSVDSEATTDLIEGFYSRLLAGESVSSALQGSKLEIRKKARFSHPFYWAGFSVFGTA